MVIKNDYGIEFLKLKPGLHHFDFEIGPAFFELFEDSLLAEGEVKVDLDFIKSENLFELLFDVAGHVGVSCDRCLNELDYPVKGKHHLIVKVNSEKKDEVEENIIYISPEDSVFDISQTIYEVINLSLPLTRFCEDVDRECNSDMIEKLDGLNSDTSEGVDPRWDKLKELYKK